MPRVKRVAIIGAESTGKTTLALQVAGALRAEGVRAALVPEAGNDLPFDPAHFDTSPTAHAYAITAKMAAESRAAMRPNVEFIVSDRSPFDHALYASVRDFDDIALDELLSSALEWCFVYDAIYMTTIAGSPYVEDGYRAPASENGVRARVDSLLNTMTPELMRRCQHVVKLGERLDKRCEFVLSHINTLLLRDEC